MKIVVFADSHGDVDTMRFIVEKERPDAVLHLGDHAADGLALRRACPGVALYLVGGNTDTDNQYKPEELVVIGSRRLFLTHGHLYDVEDSLEPLRERGAGMVAHVALFGHTHTPHLSFADGLWLMNPGRAGRVSHRAIHATYGLIGIDQGRISCAIAEVGC